MSQTPRFWRVGELAKATGLTVRTLHHYEQIGLLDSPHRSEGQHRLYDEADLRRLYRVRALRDFGLSLAEVARALEADRGTLGAVLRAHLASAERDLALLERQRDRLRRLCECAEDEVEAEELLLTIEAMSRIDRRVQERAADPGRPRDFEATWRDLGQELRACMDAGEDARSPRARQVAARVRAQLHAFAGGDPATLAALARVRRTDPPKQLAGWDPALFRYLDALLESLPTKE